MWFSKSTEEVLKEINVNLSQGLSDEEAKTRLGKYGLNKLASKKKKSIFQLFLLSFKNGLSIYYLQQ